MFSFRNIKKNEYIDLHITYMWIHLIVNICFKSTPTYTTLNEQIKKLS
jgi:hypothetical protein